MIDTLKDNNGVNRFVRTWTLVAVAVTLTGTLAGCKGPTKTYAVMPEAAKAALVGTTIPDLAFGYSARSKPAAITSNGVVWDIQRGSSEDAWFGPPETNRTMFRLSVILTAAAGGTQVGVDLQSPDGVDPVAFEVLKEQKPAIAKLWRSIALEQVDATLTHRVFSIANIRHDTAVAVLTQLPQIRQQMDDAAKEFHRQDQEKVDNAYKNDRRGG